jgi:predicted nucleic acid-binding protein
MIRVLLDTNVVLDALLDRPPWNANARAIWQAHLNNRVAAHIAATVVTDIFYIAHRHAGRERAWLAVRACLDQLYLIPVGFNELQAAAAFVGNDLEDNLQIVCAQGANLDAIVTRDPTGFTSSTIAVFSPTDLLDRLTGT